MPIWAVCKCDTPKRAVVSKFTVVIAGKLVEVERPAIEFAVETVAWNACLYSDLILREPSVFYGALEDITNLSRCHIFNLLQTEPPKFYLRLICVI